MRELVVGCFERSRVSELDVKDVVVVGRTRQQMKKFDGLQKCVNHSNQCDNERLVIRNLLDRAGGYYVHFLPSDVEFPLVERGDVGI